MAQITTINAWKYIVDEALAALSNIDSNETKIAWFGLNGHATFIQKALVSKGKRIHYIIDNDADKWGICLEDDLIVFPVEQIVNNYKDNAIFLISSEYHQEMRQQLLGMGVVNSKIISLPSPNECQIKATDYLLKQTAGLQKMELREIQLALLEIMKVFRDFCNSNGLRYFLAGGTLIGAIRHKGFIPWDNDADFYMPSEDYRRFINLFPVSGRYEVVNWEKNIEYPFEFTNIVDNHTLMVNSVFYPIKWLQNLGVDVFPISGFPCEEKAYEEKHRRNLELDRKWYWYQNANSLGIEGIHDCRRDIYELANNMPFDGSPLIVKTHHLNIKRMWSVPHSVFEKAIQVEFEGELFSAPIGYDYYLKHRFGDYMQIPPENERFVHNSIPFWKEGVK